MKDFLAGIVDYAGLFPPATLSMADAVAEYARARSGPDRWALGRFVVPYARLAELGRTDWELSVIVDRPLDVPGAKSLEMKATELDQIWRSRTPLFFEIPLDRLDLLHPIAASGGRAKIRLANTPPSAQVAAFLVACAATGLAFKATAGLHHPLRHAEGHGFLNLFLAAALAKNGGREGDLVRLLEEREPFQFEAGAASWRGRKIPLAGVRSFATSFGSCSFQEPLDHLRELKYL
ncbi:MAG TPA: hypothetical protein VF950_13115 [Planctomycetota bacterium]